MGIKPQFTRDYIRKRIDAYLKEIENVQIEALADLGEKCATHARELPPEIGFHDRTGALRSSIGYSVFKDGVAVRSWFEQVDGTNNDGGSLTGGAEGVQKGKSLAEEIGKETKGIVLVVVAGMEYAAALEAGGAWKLKSRRGYDVLASAELLAQRKLPGILSDFIDDIKLSLK